MTRRNRNERPKTANKRKQRLINEQGSNKGGSSKRNSNKRNQNNVNASAPEIVGLTDGSREYIKAIKRSTVVFCTGCPGTGKTYISVGLAADMLVAREIEKIVLTRPIASCGESLGALPGDVEEKTDPYLMPILNVINERMGESCSKADVKSKKVQKIPLELMRGASIDNAIIIADECQNASKEQLEMLITRIGENTKLIINGDLKQKDIKNSGLKYVIDKVSHVRGIEHVEMGVDDIVRSGIVKDIVKALYAD